MPQLLTGFKDQAWLAEHVQKVGVGVGAWCGGSCAASWDTELGAAQGPQDGAEVCGGRREACPFVREASETPFGGRWPEVWDVVGLRLKGATAPEIAI